MPWYDKRQYNANRRTTVPIGGDWEYRGGLEDIRQGSGLGGKTPFGAYGGSFNVAREKGTLKYHTEKSSRGWGGIFGNRRTNYYAENVDLSRDYIVSGDINDLYMTFSARTDPDLALGTVGGAEFTTHESRLSLRNRLNYGGSGQQFISTDVETIGRNKENYEKLLQSERDRRKVFTNSFFQ